MNTFHSISSFFTRLRASTRQDPVRDWLILLTLSTLALAGIVVWNVWTFDTVATGGIIGAPATGTPPVFSRSSLDTIHTIFTSRAAEEAKYMTGAYHFADPSQ
ncbi:MAG: hypothetical protein ACYC6X_02110 [Minisyncoccota bacterium]